MSQGSEGEDFGAVIDFETARGRDYPTIRQFTVFLENRVGALNGLLRRFRGSKVRIMALSISDAAECSLLRIILSHPEQGREILERAGLAIIESDLIAIELPMTDQPMLDVCTALLRAEVNLLQTYTLMVQKRERTVVALMVDNIDQAQITLATNGFGLITENELQDLG
ncbi:acetolactate synthase [Mariniblastus fucicola]|uniref:ACT domain-containing protein n=1 Tax=Mariniblastus fucicola TaxID=980251 RepID=A0A5B9PJP5_9BACT|nr:acetolactate synthase [Mariniblastus fucicola]QEG22733.1 hypothetical protein MFFC18_26160 [Mariniblastus fucicola]